MSVHVTSNVELRNYVRLLLNVELRNYVISRQIVILEWTTSLDTSSRTLFVREGGCVSGCPRHVERRVT